MKAAASTELAGALGATVRAARQGADPRPGSENGNTAAASFDAVLNDVQGAAGNGTAAEPGAAKAVPAADDTAAELPQPDGATDPASLSGTAANTVTGADAASGTAPGTDAASSGITSPGPAPYVPAPYVPAPHVPAQYRPRPSTARPNSRRPSLSPIHNVVRLVRLRCPDSRRRRLPRRRTATMVPVLPHRPSLRPRPRRSFPTSCRPPPRIPRPSRPRDWPQRGARLWPPSPLGPCRTVSRTPLRPRRRRARSRWPGPRPPPADRSTGRSMGTILPRRLRPSTPWPPHRLLLRPRRWLLSRPRRWPRLPPAPRGPPLRPVPFRCSVAHLRLLHLPGQRRQSRCRPAPHLRPPPRHRARQRRRRLPRDLGLVMVRRRRPPPRPCPRGRSTDQTSPPSLPPRPDKRRRR